MKTALPALLLMAGTAFAQEPPPPAPDVAPAASTGPVILPNLLSTNTGALVDVNFDYIDLDGADGINLMALRAHLQYLTPQGMGGYLMVPAAVLTGDADDDFQIGNVEVGGLYVMRSSPTLDILLRGGVSIDTTDPDDSSFDIFGLNLLAHFLPRPLDAFTSGGLDTTWGRAQAQITSSSQNIRFGGLVGADIPIEGAFEEVDALVNIALVAGYQDEKFGLGGGITMIQSVSDGEDDDLKGVQLVGNMAINPSARAYLAIGLNLDGDEFFDGTAFGLGIRAGL